MTPEAAALRDSMSELSEEAYYAGWIGNLERDLWTAVLHGPMRYGHLDLMHEHIQRLRSLAERCGGWIRFDDAEGEVFVPAEEWARLYTDACEKLGD